MAHNQHQHRGRAPQPPIFGDAPMETIHLPRAGGQQRPSYTANLQTPLYKPQEPEFSIHCRFGLSTFVEIIKVFIAEFLGTFILLFVGCAGHVFMPITFGVAIALASQIFGEISGAHINPAVTIAAMIMGQIRNLILVPFYILAQFAGAFVGYSLHYVISAQGNTFLESSCLLRPPNGFDFSDGGIGNLDSIGKLFCFEFLMSIIYLMAICAMWDRNNDRGSSIPLKRGFFYAAMLFCMNYIVAVPLGMNSLRAFVPMVIENPADSYWNGHWVYWVGPNVGAIFAAIIYRILQFLQKKVNQYNEDY